MRNVPNILLLILTAVGGVLLFRHRAVVAPIRAEYEGLSAKYGAFEPDDPSRHSFVRMGTDDPYTFAWRGYHPGGRRQVRFGFIPGDPNRRPEYSVPEGEYILRLQFRFAGDHLTASLVDPLAPNLAWTRSGDREVRRHGRFRHEVISFLKEHWHRLEFAMVPAGEVTLTHPDAVIVFLQIRIPEELRDELEAKTDPLTAAELTLKPLFFLTAGPQTAFDLSAGDASRPPVQRIP